MGGAIRWAWPWPDHLAKTQTDSTLKIPNYFVHTRSNAYKPQPSSSSYGIPEHQQTQRKWIGFVQLWEITVQIGSRLRFRYTCPRESIWYYKIGWNSAAQHKKKQPQRAYIRTSRRRKKVKPSRDKKSKVRTVLERGEKSLLGPALFTQPCPLSSLYYALFCLFCSVTLLSFVLFGCATLPLPPCTCDGGRKRQQRMYTIGLFFAGVFYDEYHAMLFC